MTVLSASSLLQLLARGGLVEGSEAISPSDGSPPVDDGGFDDFDGGEPDDDFNGDGRPIRWVTIATFFNPTQAHLARLRLESEGIDCVILDEFMAAHVFAVAVGGIKVQVPAERVEEARAALAPRPVELVGEGDFANSSAGPAVLDYVRPARFRDVARFPSSAGTEATLAAALLESEGIECSMPWSDFGVANFVRGSTTMTVPADQFDAAREVLLGTPAKRFLLDADAPPAPAGPAGSADHCPACGSEDLRVPKRFDRLVPLAVLLTPVLFLGAAGVAVYLLALAAGAVLFAGETAVKCRRCGHGWEPSEIE